MVTASKRHPELVATLAKETLSTLRALKADAAETREVPPEADFVVLVVEPDAPLPALPDLTQRTAVAVAVADEEREGRVAVVAARKHLRGAGAALQSRELVLLPDQFGVLGIESDSVRERIQIMMETLVLEAERLRLRREGWEDPIE